MTLRGLLVSLLTLPLLAQVQGQGAKLDLWTDVSLWYEADYEDIDFNLEFLMDNYKFISLEKCNTNAQWGLTMVRIFLDLAI